MENIDEIYIVNETIKFEWFMLIEFMIHFN